MTSYKDFGVRFEYCGRRGADEEACADAIESTIRDLPADYPALYQVARWLIGEGLADETTFPRRLLAAYLAVDAALEDWGDFSIGDSTTFILEGAD